MSSITSYIIKKDIDYFFTLNRKIRSPILNFLMKNITQMGSAPFGILISLVFLLTYRKLGFALSVNLITSQCIIHVLKRAINRPRPYKTLEWVIAFNPPRCKYSLPSGHSSCALSIVLVLLAFSPVPGSLLIPAALLVGLSRVYLGYHYPTDVAIGFAIAYAVFGALEITLFV